MVGWKVLGGMGVMWSNFNYLTQQLMKNYRLIFSFLFSSLWMACFLWSCSEFTRPIEEASTQYIAVDQGVTSGEEGAQHGQEYTSELPKPEVSHFNPLSTLSESEVKGLIKEAILLKLNASKDASNTQLAIKKFLQAAQSKHGAILATYHLGCICEERGNIDLAVRWYTLSFQNNWFQNPEKAYESSACRKLEQLGQQNIFLIHPKLSSSSAKGPHELHSLAEKMARYLGLIQFYQNKTAEPYLTSEENQVKISRIEQERAALVKTNPQVEEYMQSYAGYLQQGLDCMKEDPRKAEKIFENLKSIPDALHCRALVDETGYKTGKPDYEKAAELYEQAGTPSSFFNLGKLYQFGLVGQGPDLEQAIY